MKDYLEKQKVRYFKVVVFFEDEIIYSEKVRDEKEADSLIEVAQDLGEGFRAKKLGFEREETDEEYQKRQTFIEEFYKGCMAATLAKL